MPGNLNILLVGDVVGPLGCAMYQKHVTSLKEKYKISFVIVNGENSHSNGRGITPKLVNFFKHNHANVITSGNHIWAQKDIIPYMSDPKVYNNNLLRPANFPSSAPGTGAAVYSCEFNNKTYKIGVLNLQGRVFMRELLDCPFRTADSALTFLKAQTNIVLVDMHAEATSEKLGIGLHLDGKVSAVVGTHTHVQTNDARVFPNGTAYITDLGMTGAYNSMIGMKKEPIINNFITQLPHRFMVDTEPPVLLSGVVISINPETGKAVSIDNIKVIDEDLRV